MANKMGKKSGRESQRTARDASPKVTSKMIEAGRYWLDLYDAEYSDDEIYLTKIFTAMQGASGVHAPKNEEVKE
jgi:hypothetical protein